MTDNLSRQTQTKKSENDHSTIPDIYTGWKNTSYIPKIKQIPLIFANQSVDLLSKSLTSFGTQKLYRVVYMGPRYVSNTKIFKSYAINNKSQTVQQKEVYGLKVLQKFYYNHINEKQKFFPIRSSQYRLFTGINPTVQKQDLRFDSDFQCGNLDLAIYVNPAQYDLLMRVDSNTKGHTCWYFFRVSNATVNQKVKFNILNFCKKLPLYKQGMKPYIFRKSVGKWVQDGINVQFHKRKFRFNGQQGPVMGCLSFIYHFKTDQQVYFAYCVPYSYSYLLDFITKMKQESSGCLKLNMDNQSSGGLPIPILTITAPGQVQNKKRCLAIGRLHPGETQGSWMMQGFIRFLCSPMASFLRQKIVFKIIPMVNVDGVVLGNFRTGISGRDLNRVFHRRQDFQQIDIIRSLAQQKKPFMFLDFHGHSAKRNVFLYGPNYKYEDRYFLETRIFPKIISKKTQKFRYYSCSFKLPQSKLKTGRAILLKQHRVPFVFTIQASTFSFRDQGQELAFQSENYSFVGQKIAESLQQFYKFIGVFVTPKKYLKNKQKASYKNKSKNQQSNVDYQQKKLLECASELNQQQKNMLAQVMKEQQQQFDNSNSDQQDDSDCQDDENDYTQEQMQSFFSNNGKFPVESVSVSLSIKKKLNKQENKEKRQKNKQKISLPKQGKQYKSCHKVVVQKRKTPIVPNKSLIQKHTHHNESNQTTFQKDCKRQFKESQTIEVNRIIQKASNTRNRSAMMNYISRNDNHQTNHSSDFQHLIKSQTLILGQTSQIPYRKDQVLFNWYDNPTSIKKFASINTLQMSPQVYDVIETRSKKPFLYMKREPFIKIKKNILLPSLSKSILEQTFFLQDKKIMQILQGKQVPKIHKKLLRSTKN